MPFEPIENFDPTQIPDPEDSANFHADALYVFAHLAGVVVPGMNTNLAWLAAALAGDTATILDSLGALLAGPIGNGDVIINGAFQVNQRGHTSGAALVADTYGHDRWIAGAGGCTYTFATVENETTVTITAGTLGQIIDGENLVSGAYVLSWEGTAQARVNGGAWGDSGMAAAITGGAHTLIEFGAGTVKNVAMRRGNFVLPFARKSVGEVVRDCRRYYYRLVTDGTEYLEFIGSMYVATSDVTYINIPMPVQMRDVPNPNYLGALSDFTVYTAGSNNHPELITFPASHRDRVSLGVKCVANASNSGNSSMFRVNGSAGSGFDFEAELHLGDLP